ncbi:MAG: phytanoyl-CoA dioxygenase family protein [Candidatus Latescibacteria bacterium]|nr:phytanoyl-CoA dioxygenase family protein [Candidatus Latescibacterota bacterium]
MTKAEMYEFDLNGYIVYRNILAREEVDRMNVIIDSRPIGEIPYPHYQCAFEFMELDPCFLELMARPRTLRIIRHLLNNWLRLDHTYGIQLTRTAEMVENLGGGPRSDHGQHEYQWSSSYPPGDAPPDAPAEGRMYNGMVVVMYALDDLNPGDGGFICVPGSHKANLYYRPSITSHLVVNPPLKAGDMLIYTEALAYGIRRWQPDRRYRALIYKYSPGHAGWESFDTIKHYRELATTDLQRAILRPPNVRARVGLPFPEAEGNG